MADFVANSDRPKPTELISLNEVMRRIQRSRSTLYRWIDRGIFPRQAKKDGGTTSALWFADEVDAFIAALRNAPSESPASPLSLTPARDTNFGQNAVEIRLTSQSPKLVTKQHNPVSSKKLRSLKNESDACFVVGPVSIGGQEAFFDPTSGRLFALIGQLPMLPPSTASRSVQKHWHADEAGGEQ
jgi:predicted DNA-binding transcriptional regulator AlpA